MTITTAEYKAAIEAKISAASGATSLKDLTLIKTNADLWLLNNDGGSIAGYASLEALIQDKQDDLTVGSSNTDLSLVGVSSFPPQAGEGSSVFKNKVQITSSGNWTVPSGVYRLEVLGTGGGGAGGGSTLGDSGGGAAGAPAAPTLSTIVNVIPGQVLNIVVGAGGVGAPAVSGLPGGITSVAIGAFPILVVQGSSGGNKSNINGGNAIVGNLAASGASSVSMSITGGSGGRGGIGAGGSPDNSGAGGPPLLNGRYTGTGTHPTIAVAPAGAAGSQRGAGGAGGSSIYGIGGDGINGLNTAGIGSDGNPAPSTSYGAGGGGAMGCTAGTASGGNGANGIVEIYY